jgi:L-aspartate oxidase
LEFVQFHPTVLDEGLPHGQALLLTEALRGFGAYLVDGQGHRFMQNHPQQELAPRDEVARAIYQQPQAFLCLDHLNSAELYRRFGDIAQLAAQRGWNLAADPLPIYPGAHFCMGGIQTDTSGRTTVPDLYAVGEVAHTGVHGPTVWLPILCWKDWYLRAAWRNIWLDTVRQHRSWMTMPSPLPNHGLYLMRPL